MVALLIRVAGVLVGRWIGKDVQRILVKRQLDEIVSLLLVRLVQLLVHEIRRFNTILTHPDRAQIITPNRKIVGEILHN